MEDRYEILGKIGQGGLGAVYRSFDTRMNREVAIKRISNVVGDPELQEESTKQLVKEAGALASLQHPNIVTIYDVGADEEGPYVVMELITGKTLDELIERAPLTWPDFKELTMQIQEALIAAQELNLIHSDLKPSNLMLTWLPSGKFQVKIVDFGLASLSQSQSKHDLASIDVVFGSIYFMPPEQFERTPLDVRSDMYSIGCVYYQALTGRYPFDGKTSNDVMAAHLHHTVPNLKEVRSGIPLWACDWIMWHLNRHPHDRPESAREALSLFLQNDRMPNPVMSTGVPPTPTGPPRARVLAPVSVTKAGTPPVRANATGQVVPIAKTVQTAQVPTIEPAAVITQTAPQPLAPPEGFKPSVHTSGQHIPEIIAAPIEPVAKNQRLSHPLPTEKKTNKISKNARIAFAVVIALLLLILAGILFKGIKSKRSASMVNEIVAKAGQTGVTEIPLDNNMFQLLLDSLVGNESETELQRVGAALAIAKATDNTDLDSRIASFLTSSPELSIRAKEVLISDVLRVRNHSAILAPMLEFALSNDNPTLVVSALQSIRQMSKDDVFAKLLQLLSSTTNDQIRDAAEANISEILRKSPNVADLTQQLSSARESNFKPEVQRTLQRLISVGKSLSN